MNEKKIRIIKNGPYVVTGNVDLSEKIIRPEEDKSKDAKYVWEDGGEIAHEEAYALCRCGASKKHPFCDGSHKGSFEHQATAFDLPPKKPAS